MKDNYDFSKGVKNPYADKLKNGYVVRVRHEPIKPKDKRTKDEAEKETVLKK